MSDSGSLEDARRIARALVGEDPTPEEAERWMRAVATVGTPLSTARERRLWSMARKGGPWLGWIDAGLALVDPYSPVRHRLCLMLAVLEASPVHARRFAPREASAPIAALRLALRGAIGVARAALGMVLVSFAGMLAR